MRTFRRAIVGILLAFAGQPIHEGGHAIALRLVAGVWPRVTLWAVDPRGISLAPSGALAVLAAGDLAVLAWWSAVLLFARRSPSRRWTVVGPTVMLALVLTIWLASAALALFGRGELEALDAAKFLAIADLGPRTSLGIVAFAVLGIGLHAAFGMRRCFATALCQRTKAGPGSHSGQTIATASGGQPALSS